jgi:hypothetical protein
MIEFKSNSDSKEIVFLDLYNLEAIQKTPGREYSNGPRLLIFHENRKEIILNYLNNDNMENDFKKIVKIVEENINDID